MTKYCAYSKSNPHQKRKRRKQQQQQQAEPAPLEWTEDFKALRQQWKKAKGGKKQTLWFHAFDCHCERRCKGKWGRARNKCELECENELDEFLEG